NLAMWTRDQYFPDTYSTATWECLAHFFRLPGIIRSNQQTVSVSLRPFNDRQYNRDLHLLCQRINHKQPHLPDVRLLQSSFFSALELFTYSSPFLYRLDHARPTLSQSASCCLSHPRPQRLWHAAHGSRCLSCQRLVAL